MNGKWASETNGQSWSIKKVDGKWLLTWWRATQWGCNISDAPAVVKVDENGDLEITIASFKCMSDFVAKLKKSGDGFKGRATMNTGMRLEVALTLK